MVVLAGIRIQELFLFQSIKLALLSRMGSEILNMNMRELETQQGKR